jgi:hypothetical protein
MLLPYPNLVHVLAPRSNLESFAILIASFSLLTVIIGAIVIHINPPVSGGKRIYSNYHI